MTRPASAFQRKPWAPGAHSGLTVGLLLSLATAGCAEHRISLTEFLQMQQEARQAATTQPATTQPAAAAAIDKYLGRYKVGPGDILAVVVGGPDVLSGVVQLGVLPAIQVRIDRDGVIRLPVAGAIKVGGLDIEDVERTILQAYVPSVLKEAVVHVTLVTPDSANVLVVGAVTLGGLVQLQHHERNLLFAVNKAGGLTQAASGRATVRRLRRPTEEVTLNLTNPVELEAALALAPLEDGDIISVEAAMPNTIFVGGLVLGPGPQSYPPGVEMTVLQALAAANGPPTYLTPREATLIRRMPDGRDVQVKLDLDRLATGKDPNIALAAGDILWVPHTLETRFQEWFDRNFFVRAGMSATMSYNVIGQEFLNRRGRFGAGQGFGGGGQGLEQQFDPLGFLTRNALLRGIPTTPAPATTP